VEQNGERVYMKLLIEGTFNLKIGQEKPPFGWFSPAYGLKTKSGVLTCSRRGEPGNVSFLTAIWLGFPDEPEILRQRIDPWCTAG
ncbi:MAG: heparinase II/III family protein, partial [Desulfobaccales bacterium]